MRTVFARGPLGLVSISKETFSPPCSLSKLPSVALRWKKYSFPSSAAIKPKPRSETSFLMVPAGISISYALEQSSTQLAGPVRETEDGSERRGGVRSADQYPVAHSIFLEQRRPRGIDPRPSSPARTFD